VFKKNLLLFLLFLVSTQAELVAYYSFDGNANDFSGQYNGTVYGATLTTGYKGQAYYFDGNDYIQNALNINPNVLPKLTMGAWVRADNGSPVRQVISHDDGNYDRSLGIDNRGGGTGWSAFNGAGVLGYSPVSVGEWVFVAVSYDQSTSSVMLYVNGTTFTSTSALGTGRTYTNIGRNPISTGSEYFIGAIDEVFFLFRRFNCFPTR